MLLKFDTVELKEIMSKSKVILNIKTIQSSNEASLNLLNENALKDAFNVEIFVHQKFIKRNEVKPISSHPKKKPIKLFVETRNIILATKKFKYIINRSTNGSNLK